MNKRVLALILTAVTLLGLPGCNSKGKTEETTEVQTEPTVIETYPGVVYNPEGNDGDLNEQETTALSEDAVEETTIREEQDSAKTQNTEKTEESESSTTEPTTAPTTAPTEPNKNVESGNSQVTEQLTEYEVYCAMSGTEQAEFIESFNSAADFVVWYNNAKAEYDALHPAVEINGDSIDANDIVANNG